MHESLESMSDQSVFEHYRSVHLSRLVALDSYRLGVLPEDIENVEVPPEREMTDID